MVPMVNRPPTPPPPNPDWKVIQLLDCTICTTSLSFWTNPPEMMLSQTCVAAYCVRSCWHSDGHKTNRTHNLPRPSSGTGQPSDNSDSSEEVGPNSIHIEAPPPSILCTPLQATPCITHTLWIPYTLLNCTTCQLKRREGKKEPSLWVI